MAELRDVIRRLKLGHGVRDIHRSTGVHRTIVRQLRDVALELGWLEADHELPSEQQIEQARRRVKEEAGAGKSLFEQLAAHEEDFQRWHEQEYTAVVMRDLIRKRVPCSLSTIDRYLRSRFPKPVHPVSRRDTVAGKVMEVDFGYLGITYDPNTRRNRRTWAFSGRLRHCRRAWRERCFDQKQPTFFVCHIYAFEFLGGVVDRVVADNLKATVVKASFQDPIVNRVYRALAEHYGFLIDPCPPYRAKPSDTPRVAVESSALSPPRPIGVIGIGQREATTRARYVCLEMRRLNLLGGLPNVPCGHLCWRGARRTFHRRLPTELAPLVRTEPAVGLLPLQA